uniref:Uncharacterized protein n=1 Tax=uncultured Elusimicrobia bacterium TaxID=699876 RepID=A0A650EM28_9BACT|nr:hypothetical protein Elusimicrob1349_1630 [uncultured Elusimicrobia bacterium]
MKKFLLLRAAVGLLCILFPALETRGQAVSPWFRGSAQAWKTLTEKSFSAAQLTATPLIRPMSGLSTGRTVKTTIPNWLSHRLSHSNTFSRMEKDLFKLHPANPAAVSGKLSYFWDRDALLAASTASGEMNQNAFDRHQELLEQTLAEVEDFNREYLSEHFNSPVFAQEELLQLLKDPAQPPAFILTRREIETFPTLTLSEQQAFSQQAWRNASARLAELLQMDPQTLSTQSFSNYYYLKLRQRYFTTLYQVLQKAQSPRQTAIVRVRKKLPLDFLPESEQALTDAQRLGKLHFYADLMQSHGKTFTPDFITLKTELARQQELYYPYAVAEAFAQPYENVLMRRNYPAELYFNAEDAAALSLLTSQEAVNKLPQKIARVQANKQNLLADKTPTPDAYIHYFRLAAQEEFLKTRLARAQFFLQYLP